VDRIARCGGIPSATARQAHSWEKLAKKCESKTIPSIDFWPSPSPVPRLHPAQSRLRSRNRPRRPAPPLGRRPCLPAPPPPLHRRRLTSSPTAAPASRPPSSASAFAVRPRRPIDRRRRASFALRPRVRPPHARVRPPPVPPSLRVALPPIPQRCSPDLTSVTLNTADPLAAVRHRHYLLPITHLLRLPGACTSRGGGHGANSRCTSPPPSHSSSNRTSVIRRRPDVHMARAVHRWSCALQAWSGTPVPDPERCGPFPPEYGGGERRSNWDRPADPSHTERQRADRDSCTWFWGASKMTAVAAPHSRQKDLPRPTLIESPTAARTSRSPTLLRYPSLICYSLMSPTSRNGKQDGNHGVSSLCLLFPLATYHLG
jgi:hypothetical protein